MTREPVRIGETVFGGGRRGWILGPCMLESRELALRVAEAVADLADERSLGVVFKGSFDKANRTRGDSHRGPGLEAGLEILAEVRRETGLPVLTDIHEPAQASPAAEVADGLQIPAFLCRQTDLIAAAAETGRPVLIKKGQFMAPADMAHAVDKASGGPVLLAERGTSFGYGDLVVDYRGLVEMRRHAPVIFDGTHAVQRPGGAGGSSGGDRHYLVPLCRAAGAVGIDGFFLEVHPDPDNALSDRQTQLPLTDLGRTITAIEQIAGGTS